MDSTVPSRLVIWGVQTCAESMSQLRWKSRLCRGPKLFSQSYPSIVYRTHTMKYSMLSVQGGNVNECCLGLGAIYVGQHTKGCYSIQSLCKGSTPFQSRPQQFNLLQEDLSFVHPAQESRKAKTMRKIYLKWNPAQIPRTLYKMKSCSNILISKYE